MAAGEAIGRINKYHQRLSISAVSSAGIVSSISLAKTAMLKMAVAGMAQSVEK